jgi:hypothetical protein
MLTLLPKGVQTNITNFSDWRFFPFVTCVNDFGSAPWVTNISENFQQKIRNGANGIHRCLGETYSWKNLKWKILWHCLSGICCSHSFFSKLCTPGTGSTCNPMLVSLDPPTLPPPANPAPQVPMYVYAACKQYIGRTHRCACNDARYLKTLHHAAVR